VHGRFQYANGLTYYSLNGLKLDRVLEYANRHSSLRQINTHPLKQGRELETCLDICLSHFLWPRLYALALARKANDFSNG